MHLGIVRLASAALLTLFALQPLHAAQRTFVSAVGNDANPCSLVAPCRSFSQAMTATDVNGEIVVLDSGGYGRVTIDKSLTITAPPGVYAGISVFPGTNGIDIATAGIKVALRGLTINGQGGNDGISVLGVATTVDIERCAIAHMTRYGVYAGADGVNLSIKDSSVQDSDNTGLYLIGAIQFSAERIRVERNGSYGINMSNEARGSIADSLVADNANTGLQFGNTANVGTMVLVLSGSRVHGNALSGVGVSTGASGTIKFEGNDNVISDNAANGVLAAAAGGATVVATLRGNTIAHNGAFGVLANVDATVNAADNIIVANVGAGLRQQNNAVLNTLVNNAVRDNNGGGAQTEGVITMVGGL